MTEEVLDPLVFGSPESRLPIGLFKQSAADVTTSTALPSKTSSNSNAFVREPRTRVDRPEMDERDKADEDELNAILEKVREEQSRRNEENKRVPKHVKLELYSDASDDDAETIAKRARHTSVPHVCLVGPQHLDNDLLAEWNTFCRKACGMHKTLHCDSSRLATPVGILCFDRLGRCMIVDEAWTKWLLHNGSTRELFVMCMLDTTRAIKSLQQLQDGMSALVYDCECARTHDVMLKWRCDNTHCVIPLVSTPLNYSCVVTRRNQMYEIIKL